MALADYFSARFRQWSQAPVEVQLVCEIAADYVAAARYRGRRLESWVVGELPAGAVRPAPLADNIAEPVAVREALRPVMAAVADGENRCVLLMPDLAARVALLELDQLPARAREADGLLRWRLKKDLPFDVSQAVLSYKVQPGRATVHEVLAVTGLRTILRQYEECLENLGFHPGLVSLSTLATLDCLQAKNPAPRLLVKRDRSSLSLAIVHGDAVRMFRSLPLASEAHELNVDALFEKIYPAVVYFQDQWDQPVSEIVLAGLGTARALLAEKLSREVGCTTGELNPAARDLLSVLETGATPDSRLLPIIGWVRGQD
jgi:Tfp pilus assembly PilM family ATPase